MTTKVIRPAKITKGTEPIAKPSRRLWPITYRPWHLYLSLFLGLTGLLFIFGSNILLASIPWLLCLLVPVSLVWVVNRAADATGGEPAPSHPWLTIYRSRPGADHLQNKRNHR